MTRVNKFRYEHQKRIELSAKFFVICKLFQCHFRAHEKDLGSKFGQKSIQISCNVYNLTFENEKSTKLIHFPHLNPRVIKKNEDKPKTFSKR